MPSVQTIAPHYAVMQVFANALPRLIPELSGKVHDEALLTDEQKDALLSPSRRGGELQYPFVSLLYDGIAEQVEFDPPRQRGQRTPASVSAPTFEYDIAEQYPVSEIHRFRVTLYDKVGADRSYPTQVLLSKIRNYFVAIADSEISPSTALLWGLERVYYNPSTGLLAADQENPTANEVKLDACIMSVGLPHSEQTVLNVARSEARWAFNVDVGLPAMYENLIPTVEQLTGAASFIEDADVVADIPKDADLMLTATPIITWSI